MNITSAPVAGSHRHYETTIRPMGGLTWTFVSRNERAVTHGGRHFFAMRCTSGCLWRIFEHDKCVTAQGRRILRESASRFMTGHLSDAVRVICGGPGPRPWTCSACGKVNAATLVICLDCQAAPFAMLPYELPGTRQ